MGDRIVQWVEMLIADKDRKKQQQLRESEEYKEFIATRRDGDYSAPNGTPPFSSREERLAAIEQSTSYAAGGEDKPVSADSTSQKVSQDAGRVEEIAFATKDIDSEKNSFLSSFTNAEGNIFNEKEVSNMTQQEKLNILKKVGKGNTKPEDIDSLFKTMLGQASELYELNRR